VSEVASWIARDAPWIGLDDQEAARRLLAPVAEAYDEPQRRYHDRTHLGEMLEAVHTLRPRCRDFPAVLLAAWFHDGVYRPERRDNEAQSAAWARRALAAAGFPPEQVARVERLVLDTDPGAEAPADPDSQVLFDADRRIWAAAPPRYAAYARGVRAEYGRYSWTSYARGRRRFLTGALRRAAGGDRLFFHLGTEDEQTARRNLVREARCLFLPRVVVACLVRRDPLAPLDRA
jgi:predicted metal-dependent HD superfamily phosphohydrolase